MGLKRRKRNRKPNFIRSSYRVDAGRSRIEKPIKNADLLLLAQVFGNAR